MSRTATSGEAAWSMPIVRPACTTYPVKQRASTTPIADDCQRHVLDQPLSESGRLCCKTIVADDLWNRKLINNQSRSCASIEFKSDSLANSSIKSFNCSVQATKILLQHNRHNRDMR